MQERIIEIIIFLISELHQKRELTFSDFNALLELGFTNSEISTALSWLIDKSEINNDKIINAPIYFENSFRILNENEKDIFTKEAWGKILQMNTLGLMPNEYIEMMIDKAESLGLKDINEEQLKHFIASTVFNLQFKDMYGSRLMLNSDDTIN